jgi:hypothetical protein
MVIWDEEKSMTGMSDKMRTRPAKRARYLGMVVMVLV